MSEQIPDAVLRSVEQGLVYEFDRRGWVAKGASMSVGPIERPKPKLSPLNALRRLDKYCAGAVAENAEGAEEALEVLWEYVTNLKRNDA